MEEVQFATTTVESYNHDNHIFVPSSFFPTSQPLNSLDPMYGMRAITQGLLPPGTNYFVPWTQSVTVDWTSPGWFCIYEFPFRIGLKFPCSGLLKDLLVSLGVSPCQLMQSMWKMTLAIEALGREHGCPLLVTYLKNTYVIRSHGRRLSFRVRKNCFNLILGLDNGDDKGWNTSFLFLRKDSLGEECEFIPCDLQSEAPSWLEDTKDKESEDRIKRFLSIPAFDRTWPLASIPLCPSGQVEPKAESTKVVSASPNLRVSSSRGSLKVEDVLARAKLEGLKLPAPRKAGQPRTVVTSLDTILASQVPESVCGDKDSVVKPQIEKVESVDKGKRVMEDVPHAWKDEDSIVGLKRKRVIKVSKLAVCNFDGIPMTEGHMLLDEINKVEQEKFDLTQLTVKMVACTSQAFQCALAIGHGYKNTMSSLKEAVANNKELDKNMNLLLSSSAEEKQKMEALRSKVDGFKASLEEQELRIESLAAEKQKIESLLIQSNAFSTELQLENRHLKETQQVEALFYKLTGKLEVLLNPDTHNLQTEIHKFKRIFPEDIMNSPQPVTRSQQSRVMEEKERQRPLKGISAGPLLSEVLIQYEQ